MLRDLIAFFGGAGVVFSSWADFRVLTHDKQGNSVPVLTVLTIVFLLSFAACFFGWYAAAIGFALSLATILSLSLRSRKQARLRAQNVDFVVSEPSPLLDRAVSPELHAELTKLEAKALKGELGEEN